MGSTAVQNPGGGLQNPKLSMNSSIHTWQITTSKGTTNDLDDTASTFSSDIEQEDPLPQGADINLTSQVSFWSKETLISCICGAPPDSYCTCLPTSLNFAPENDYFEQPPVRNQEEGGDSPHSPARISSTGDPQVCVTGKSPAPTRKERRRQQNRAAQVRHRDKRNRVLHETMRNTEALNEELKQTRAQRDYFRLMYEDLETQVMQLQSQSSSRVQSHSPRQI